MYPVREKQESVIHGNQDVRDDSCKVKFSVPQTAVEIPATLTLTFSPSPL